MNMTSSKQYTFVANALTMSMSSRALDVPSEVRRVALSSSNGCDNMSFTPTTSNLRRASNSNQPIEPTTPTSSSPLHLILEQEPMFPEPLSPEKCPLFCCFYAEFDIRVGPKVCFQSPRGFMDKDMALPTNSIHEILAKTFAEVRNQEAGKHTTDGSVSNPADEALWKSGSDHSTNLKQTGGVGSLSSEVALSIFDSTSDYIITGNELAGKIINLSTHYMHILTRPTVISNERYERNSLLFSVGFVLRRAEDPRTFRPLLSKWASTLRSMEVESNFLTDPTTRPQIQPMLDRLLVSLNSAKSECHLLMNQANILSLKRFRPPKPPASPVPDHAVPILLRRDWELHLYDWDLAINWVVLHIDGVANAKQISKRSEVDMEMVRACLRVLKHHGVIALVDMFFYTNRYEFTEKATAMLAGKEPELLQQAIDYIVKIPVDASRHSEPVFEFSRGGEGMPAPMFSSRSPVSFPPSSDRLHVSGLRSVPSLDTGARRMDDMLRSAIAELHCACTRNVSFADILLSLVSTSPLAGFGKNGASTHNLRISESRSGSLHLSSRREMNGLPDQNGNATLSPSDYGYMDKLGRQQFSKSNIDWKAVFDMFDHRRWATFAVVHGLLRRLHNHPLVLNSNELFEKHRTTGCCLNSLHDEDKCQLSTKIASMMDGTHSDDELVTEFSLPLEKLFQLVTSSGEQVIFSVYSTSTPSG